MTNKGKLSLFILLFFGTLAYGQIAVNNNYLATKHDGLDRAGDGDQIAYAWRHGVGVEIGLKEKGISFHPSVYYTWTDFRGLTVPDAQRHTISYNGYGLSVPVQFYVFRLNESCDCPTWDDGPGFIAKNFFVHLSPDLEYRTIETQTFIPRFGLEDSVVIEDKNELTYGTSLGLGLDLPLGRSFKFTAAYAFGIQSSHDWEDVSTSEVTRSATTYHGLNTRLTFYPGRSRTYGRR